MKLKVLLPLLGLAIILLVVMRGCNSTEVVVVEDPETVKVKQMMNEIVLQQQQTEGNPSAAPAAP